MQQANDFLEESEILFNLLDGLDEEIFAEATLFKNWTVNEILIHLHFWNLGADLSLNDPGGFTSLFEELYGALKTGKLRSHENGKVTERGQSLLKAWRELYLDMAKRWVQIDPKTRVKWAGPDMSVRSSISARQMETWAHGQAIFDLLGKDRPESDRIKNVVVLGINAFGWSHKVHGLEIPETAPFIKLNAPSGEVWKFGEPTNTNLITGDAVEFCQVVTQTRNVADTSLNIVGEISQIWMENAQCFAGPPVKPPEPGVRKKSR